MSEELKDIAKEKDRPEGAPPNFETALVPNQFLPGVSGNPKGRPRKFVTQMKEAGYKKSEIDDTIRALLACRLDELKEIYESPQSTILEKVVANALRKGLERGSVYTLELLISRVFGSPKESVEHTGEEGGPIEITIRPSLGPPLARSESEVRDV